MCGIVGFVSKTPVVERLLDGLKRLEYRGYDSTGVATIANDQIQVRRAKGKLEQLQAVIKENPILGNIGIGHTRWATHGVPSEVNAHPHSNGRVAIVHNGIIENHAELRSRLLGLGYAFQSQTDTEVIVHLLTEHLKQGHSSLEAFRRTLDEIHGAFAIAVIVKDQPETLMVARFGSPLVIGYGNHEMMVGSDALTLAPWTQKICYLEEGDYAIITVNGADIFNQNHQGVERPIIENSIAHDAVSKGGYQHYMLKEILEQPTTISNTLSAHINQANSTVHFDDAQIDWAMAPKLTIVACGTSYYAAMVAKYWFEKYARLPVEVDIASEFRYRETPLPAKGLALFISQSGETIDTLTALQLANEQGQNTIAVINVPQSSMSRMAHNVIYTHAGPEIGVASTKAFTAQLAVLACLVIQAGRLRNILSSEDEKQLIQALEYIPGQLAQVFYQDEKIKLLAQSLVNARDTLFLGRGTSYPIALEGALKLKEISYIHAEGYPAGELKHGPIALIDKEMPVVVIAPNDQWLTKTLSNIQEVIARGAQTICFTDHAGHELIQKDNLDVQVLELPEVHPFVQPLLYAVPLQLLAYHTAVLRGTDVDQPRNLAKSVTVE